MDAKSRIEKEVAKQVSKDIASLIDRGFAAKTSPNNKPWVAKDESKRNSEAKQVETKQSKETLQESAKNTSETALNNAIKQSPDPEVRQTAHEELQRRESEEKPKEEKDSNNNEKESLSKFDKDLIEEYTESLHESLNSELRQPIGDPDLEEKANDLSEAINKLPDFKGNVIRFQPINEITLKMLNSNIGKVITFKAFTSTSKIEDLSKKKKNDFIFKIKSNSGKDISSYSSREEEQEVLFDKGSKFKLISIDNNILNFEQNIDKKDTQKSEEVDLEKAKDQIKGGLADKLSLS